MPARELVDVDAVPVVPWPEFFARFDWRQGEHVAAVGATGRGKTHLALAILPRRQWRCVVATKPKDATLAGLVRSQGYHRIEHWPPPNDRISSVLLWPKWTDAGSRGPQARAIGHALNAIFREGSWCVFADDVQYLTDELRLGAILQTMWLQARALDVSLVAATQRPRHVPRLMWSQSTHLFVWGTRDDQDLRALGGFGGLDDKLIRRTVAQLDGHDVLYVNTRTGALAVTRAPER
jgi:hypothetical protein